MSRFGIRPVALMSALAVVATLAVASDSRLGGAAAGAADTTWVPITPCRLFDFRPGVDNVGPRSVPLGENETHVVQTTGANGNCVIPANAVAVSMNVTITDPTAVSFLTIFSADVDPAPLAANLNWLAGQPPTPNTAQVALSSAGAIKLYNLHGTVNVIADITGYSIRSTLVELQTQVAGLQAAVDSLSASKSFVVHESGDQSIVVTSPNPVGLRVRSLHFFVPAAGTVTVDYTVNVIEPDAGEGVDCSVRVPVFSETNVDSTHRQSWVSPGTPGGVGQISGTRTFAVASDPHTGDRSTYVLVCEHTGPDGSSELRDSSINATFNPAGPPIAPS